MSKNSVIFDIFITLRDVSKICRNNIQRNLVPSFSSQSSVSLTS